MHNKYVLQPIEPQLVATAREVGRVLVEIALVEISHSMKVYPPVLHAYTSKLRPAIVFLSSHKLSMRFPTVFRQPLTALFFR